MEGKASFMETPAWFFIIFTLPQMSPTTSASEICKGARIFTKLSQPDQDFYQDGLPEQCKQRVYSDLLLNFPYQPQAKSFQATRGIPSPVIADTGAIIVFPPQSSG